MVYFSAKRQVSENPMISQEARRKQKKTAVE